MANYEFPSGSKNTSTTVDNNSSLKVKLDYDGEPIKVTWENGTPLTEEELAEHTEEIKEEVEKLREEEEKRAEKREKIWRGVKDNLSNVTDKVADVGEDVSDHVVSEVFGSGVLANQMNNMFGKILQGIAESLKKISSFVTGTLVKVWHGLRRFFSRFYKIFSENGLLGTLKIFFRWIRITLVGGFSKLWKMLESIKLFSLLGKMIGGLGNVIKGTISASGNLFDFITKAIVGSAAWQGILSGIKWVGSVLSSISLKGLLSSITEWLVTLIPKGVAGTVAGVAAALYPTEAGDRAEDAYMAALNNKKIPKDMTLEEFKKQGLNALGETKEQQEARAETLESLHKLEYDNFLKEFPTVSQELFKKRWLIDSDKDKNGLRDYNDERWATTDQLRRNPTNESLLKDLGLSDAAKEELKNKSKLKNTAKVSST